MIIIDKKYISKVTGKERIETVGIVYLTDIMYILK
jgi:hypothetical protein